MPKKIQDCSMAHLISVPLPAHGASYTTISHQFVIDYSKQQLQAAGFSIVDEEYRCTADGQIAQGVYKLNFNSDPEISMMFAWTNSYNKQVKFKCLVGAYINQTGSVMTSGDIGSWTRKHTGTADTETKDMIDDHIANAHMYYTQLASDKASMEGMVLNKRRQAQMLGILFAEYQILTTEQASMIRQQMDRPSFVFKSSDSLWAFYNYVTIALQHSHPRTWMEDQRILHYFISTVANFQTVPAPVPVIVTSPLAETNPELHYGLSTLAKAEADMLIHGDSTGFKQIGEVMKQAQKDELIFGVSGIQVSEDGVRNLPIEEVLEKMQQADNQVVQERVENEGALHEIEETESSPIIADTETSDAFIGIEEDEELMREAWMEDVEAGEYGEDEAPSIEIPIPDMIIQTEELTKDEVIERYGDVLTEEQLESINSAGSEKLDETIHYTDPAGNTFEAPVVPPCAGHDSETEKDLEEDIRKTELQNFLKEVDPDQGKMEKNIEDDFSLPGENSLAPSPADYELMEATEHSEGTVAVADLDNIPIRDEDDLSFDLGMDDDNEDPDTIPDFF